MRTIRRMVWLLVLACLLVGCGQQTAEEEALAGAYVYYINNSGTALLSAPSGVEGNDENALKKLFVTLRDGEFPEGHSALPKTVDLDHTAWQEKCLVLYLTGEYPQAGTPEETLCRAALAQTLLFHSPVSPRHFLSSQGIINRPRTLRRRFALMCFPV